MADTKNDKNSNSPALRFPGFTEPWQRTMLDRIVTFEKKRLRNCDLRLTEYVSTDNMLSDFGGVRVANRISKTGTSTSFIKGDILVSNIRPYLNKIWYATFDGGCSPDVFVYRAKKNIVTSPFLYNILANKAFITYVMNGAKGVKMPRGDKEQMMKYPCSIPSLQEQDKISSLLKFIDERIATQRRLIDKLETLIKGVREHCLKNISGEMVYLSSIAEIYQPQTISSLELVDNGFPIYGANGIIGYYNSYNHETEQICITCRGNTCGTVNYSLAKSWITGNAMVVNTDSHSDIVCKRFLFHFLSEYNFKSIISGSGQPQIVRSPLQKLKVKLPSLDKQSQIANFLDAILHKTDLEYSELNLLQKQRQHLLQRMFI